MSPSNVKGQANPRLAIKQRRDQVARLLLDKMGSSLQITGFSSFVYDVCLVVIVYSSEFTVAASVREQLEEVMEGCDHSADLKKLPNPPDLSSIKSSVPPNPALYLLVI